MTAASITHAAKADALAQYVEHHGGTLRLDAATYADAASGLLPVVRSASDAWRPPADYD
ncbi:MAG: hypothetical protein WKF96_17695 [Solirubrobacteraceae bacterium]